MSDNKDNNNANNSNDTKNTTADATSPSSPENQQGQESQQPQQAQQPQQGAGQKLDPNVAVDRAAERAKSTSDKNLPAFGDLPIPDDTANLRKGPNLHDGLLALLPLVGVWRGQGQAAHPGEEEFTFGQQIIFAHDGENRLSYDSRTWRMDDDGKPLNTPDRRESGFLRISESDEIEMIITHSDGMVEIMYGEPISERAWQLESASTMATATGPTKLGPGKRLYGLMPNNDLGWVDERLIDGEMVPWMSAQLARVVG
ncbi:FABP family protein [Corynebacterium falsenii]|uniref:Ferric nitrobindin-like protein n=1 Tax=Corynebacterium falsenii TaxID=108486 RepID=A0A418Q655_9CORY|nr:FABP family protein [Corynebacterium falsenii]AHI02577.1 fatty acid-binding protein [Corynebacterium falsenii DSM 44353]MDC7104109.1 FABP family protein [Corynebacterium falsenii]RIX34247.1 FABP family protein [Corynebacterium falsenii]UBI05359.1 FABP family protein [Corynebacterium falsenii]HJF11807.1 FABP family protein [Corynebacterium falsenii]